MYTIEDIKAMLEKDGRGFKLVDSSFIKMSVKATFIHPIYGEWQAKPYKVLVKKTTHPKESNLKRSISNRQSRENGQVLEATKQTNMKRYGVEFTGQVKDFIVKKENTCLSKYGSKSVLSNDKFRKKGEDTRLERYGNKNYRNEDKIKQTNMKRYGNANAMSNKTINSKAIETKENNGQITRPRGKSWQELALELNVPRTSLQEFVRNNPSEQAIEEFLTARCNNYSNIEHSFSQLMNTTKFIGQVVGYRPDFKIESIFVNVDGLYWHSQKIDRNKTYHFKLRESFERDNKRILQFRADDIKYRPNIVKSIVDNISGIGGTHIYARKCTISEVNAADARVFLQNNHMMGSSNSRFIGLYAGTKLVSVMGFKIKGSTMDIDRFASLLDHRIVGGLSKMIKYLENKYGEQVANIHYWVDLRYGTGESLKKIGFNFKRDIQGWQWTDFDKTYHRSKCTATKDLSQTKNAENMGLWQIYDAGQRLYIKTI